MIKRDQFENYAIRLLKRILIKYLKYIGKDHEHVYLTCSIIKEDGDDKYYIDVHNEHWKDRQDHDCPVDRWAWEDANE